MVVAAAVFFEPWMKIVLVAVLVVFLVVVILVVLIVLLVLVLYWSIRRTDSDLLGPRWQI